MENDYCFYYFFKYLEIHRKLKLCPTIQADSNKIIKPKLIGNMMCLNLTSFLNHYSSFRKLYILLVGGWIPLMSSYVLNPLFLCQLNYLFNSLLTFSWLNRSLLIISLLQSSSSSNKVSTRSDCNSAEKSKTLANYMINFMYCASMHAWFIYCLYYSIKYNIFFKHYNQSSSFSTLCISYISVK